MRHISELLVYYIIVSLILLPFSAADVPDSVENKLIDTEKDWLGEFGKVSLIDYGLKSKLEKIDLLLNPNDKLYDEIIGESSAKSLSEKDMAHYSRLAELISPGVAKENSIPLLINGWFYRLYGNTIYATKDNKVIAIDNKTGQIAWHLVLENDLSEGLAVDENSNVYVATKNELYSISKDGRENWHTHFYSERGKVIGYSNGIVLAQFDDTLLAINKSSNTIWSKSRIAGNIIIDGYDVYATFKLGDQYYIKSLDLLKGNTRWSSQAFPYIIGVELEPKDSQAKAGKTVYAVGDITEEPKEIWALDINTGSKKNLQKSTITVCKSGCTYSTIQSGLDAAIPGDTVYVSDGAIYVEDITSWPGDMIALDCNGATIQGNGDGFGIIFYYNNYNSVKRCVIDNHESGVYIMYSDSNVIQSNTLKNQRQGITLDFADQNTILSNTINASNTTSGWSDTFGIVLSYDSSNNTIQGNYIHDATGVGILFIPGSYTQIQNLIDNNQIYFNNFGIWFEDDSDFNEIKGNTIRDNNEGIRFNWESTSSDNYIHDNTFCPSNANFDILEESGYGQQGNHGINNRCNTASGWDDDGATGCTFSCGALECGGTDTSCGIYPSCANCNSNDGCNGNYSRNYYCVSNAAGCSYNSDNCNDCSCSCGGYNTAESTANGNCADGKDNDCDGYTDAADPGCSTCVCSSGSCCDGCNYRSSSYVCNSQYATDYGCPWGTACSNDVGVSYQQRYCSGSSSVCDGLISGWGNWSIADNCNTTEICANDDSTCNYNASCSCVCSSGLCCDGCSYKPSSYLCQQDVTTDYGCPWGTNCGNDVGVHHQDMYCSGSSSVCDGALQWDSWSLADDCATSSEKCTDNDATCNFDVSCCQCTSGVCCDGCSYKPSSYICQQNLITEYGCPWGTGSGYIRGVHHQDKYCSGSSENCSGSLQWDAWAFYQGCGFLSCGAWGANYCKSSSVYHNRTCEDGGCLGTTCFYTGPYIEEGLVANCQYGCGNGLCLGHCENGIKDSDEIGIDCGGSCPNQECCNNGYADADLGEQGVDCEGPCPYSCIVPVILVHGYDVVDPNLETWPMMKQRLENDGFTVEVADLEVSDIPARGDIRKYAMTLKNEINDVKNKYGVKRVDIVAHSMGGLVSRWYLRVYNYSDVRKLIMLGTPNHGSELTTYFYFFVEAYEGVIDINAAGQAFHQMKPGSYFLNTLNCENPSLKECEDITMPNAYYYTIAGTGGGIGTSLVLPGSDDGVVSVASVRLDSIGQRLFGSDHSGLTNDSQPYTEVKYQLETESYKSSFMPPQKSSIGIQENPQQLPTITGTIQQDQETNHSVELQNINSVAFALGNFNASLNFTLTDPNGTIINADTVNITYEKGNYTQVYLIETPLNGGWVLTVFGYDVNSTADYTIYTFVETNITLGILLNKTVYKPNEQLNISAELKDGLNPILGAIRTAKIERPDNSETFTFLYDDGNPIHNDNISNDGIYSNIYTGTNLAGQYDLVVTAAGVAAGASFEREKVTSFWVEDYPDLTITNITFSNNNPIVGENVTISAYVKNLKNIDTFNATIEFYYNGRYEDIFIGNRTINVPRLGTGTASVVWAPDSGGTYNITAIISPFNDFMEENYTNNIYVKNLSVGYLGFNKQLYSGWNLVSVPFVLKNSTLPNALSSINGSYNVVFAYDANDVGNEWKSYDPVRPAFLNNLAELNPKLGYWIDMTRNDILELQGAVPVATTFNLKQGWNLVGYPSLNQTNATILFAPIANNLEVVFKYDTNDPGNEWKSYNPERPGFLNTLTIMQPGYGYWVKATQGTSLTVS